MPTNIEYALMAGYAYYSTRDEINRFPPPSGWAAIPQSPEYSGFEVVTFQRGSDASAEIVISYAGTDPDDSTGDVAADAALGAGLGSEQLYQAVEYYLRIKAINPDATITLTGHSLGGGLASLVAVFFNETAVTFDQGPFRNSANMIVANNLLWSMASKFPAAEYPQITTWLAPLDRFIRSFDPFGLGWSADGLDAREAKVTNLSVQGEFLSALNILRIGTELDPLTHGDYFGPVDLHSQALLTTFVQNDGFRKVSFTLTDLLPMIFDENLFEKSLKSEDPNLLEHLLRHQVGGVDGVAADGDNMLARFTADLQKLAATDGLSISGSDLTKGLIAFAMQAYYEGRIATEVGKQLYETISGGIRFERSDISADPDLNKIKGYAQYFKNYLATLPADEQEIINQQLPALLDWYIAGAQMTAAAEDKAAFMLGSNEMDDLTGGTKNDLLIGGAGADILHGGGGDDALNGGTDRDMLYGNAGEDKLYGGAEEDYLEGGGGNDTLVGGDGKDIYRLGAQGGQDRIEDDGGVLMWEDKVVAGVFIQVGTSGTYRHSGDESIVLDFSGGAATLRFADGTQAILERQTTPEAFDGAPFGIRLAEKLGAAPQTTNTISGDKVQTLFTITVSEDYANSKGLFLSHTFQAVNRAPLELTPRDIARIGPGAYDPFGFIGEVGLRDNERLLALRGNDWVMAGGGTIRPEKLGAGGTANNSCWRAAA